MSDDMTHDEALSVMHQAGLTESRGWKLWLGGEWEDWSATASYGGVGEGVYITTYGQSRKEVAESLVQVWNMARLSTRATEIQKM